MDPINNSNLVLFNFNAMLPIVIDIPINYDLIICQIAEP